MPEDLTDELLSWAKEQLEVDRESAAPRIEPIRAVSVQVGIRTVVQEGIAAAAAVLLPGDIERQELIPGLLLTGSALTWPLVDGTHPADLVLRTAGWANLLRALDTRPAIAQRDAPALAMVCAEILERLRRADERGAVGLAWRHFVERTGIGAPAPQTSHHAASGAAAGPGNGAATGMEHHEARFQLDNPQAHNLIQGQTVQVHLPQQSSPPAATAPAVPLRPHNFKRGPLLLGRIPPLAAARQERPADHAVAAALADGPNAMVCQVVSGMAGTGKTQIAAAYARQRWDSSALQLMVWVNADSRTSITAAFAEAAVRVCGSDGADQERAATEFLDWLDRPTGPRWLIVLDGVTEPKHLVGLWPPESSHGRTVITTRIRSASWRGARRAVVDVGSFTPEDAAAYLSDQLGQRSKRIKGAADLSQALGHLPLALAQVAAFIHNQPDLTCDDYRQMLAAGTVGPDDLCPGTALDDYPHSLAESLQRSIELTEHHRPSGLCLGLLRLMSLLDPAGIPIALLRSDPVIEALAADIDRPEGRTEDRTGAPLTAWAVNTAVGRLHQLSLVDSEGGVVRIHPLVQRLALKGLPAESRGGYARALADTMTALWPSGDDDLDLEAMLGTCGMRLRELAAPDLIGENAHDLFFNLGNSLGMRNRPAEATAYFDRLEVDFTRTLGFEHVHTLGVRGRSAWWRAKAGDADGAVAAFEELVLDRLRILGPDHSATLMGRDDLAWVRGEAGDAAGAVADYAALVPDWIRAFGPDDSRTLDARAFLAAWRKTSGDSATALLELEHLLPDQARVLGPDHPDTLTTRSEIGECLGETENYEAAIAAHEELLAIKTRVFGVDHPSALDTRFKHARWLGLGGDAAGAASEYAALVPDQIRVLGPDHEDTLLARNNLTHFRSAATGDMAEATAAYTELLIDVERALGPDHPRAELVRGNLAASQG
jgi:hypothetical protein